MSTRKGASTSTGRRSTSQSRPAKTIDLKAEETKPQAAKTGGAKPAAQAKPTVPKAGPAAKPAEKPSTVKKEPPKSGGTTASPAKPNDSAHKQPAGGGTAAQKPANAPSAAKQSQETATNRGRVTGLLAASIIGGVVSLGIVGGLNGAGLLGAVPGLGGLQGNGGAGGQMAELDTLRTELDELRASQSAFSSRLEGAVAEGAGGAGLNDLLARSDALEAAIAANSQKIEALATASADRTTSGAAGQDTATSDQLTAINERLTGAESELATLRENLQQGGSDETLSQAIAALEARLDEEVAGLASAVDSLESADITALPEKVAEIEAALEELREARAERSSSEDRIARSVAANALQTGYERGEPFAGLLASVQALTGPLDAASTLEQQAAKGVRTAQQLAQEFGELAGEIIHQAQPPADGVVSQLLSNARSLVRVRPSGPMDGNSPEAVVSRIEGRLDKADLEGALEQWNALPEAAKTHSRRWASALEERLTADRAMARVLDALMPQATQPDSGQSQGEQSG